MRVLLSTQNMFCLRNKKITFNYALLSGGFINISSFTNSANADQKASMSKFQGLFKDF